VIDGLKVTMTGIELRRKLDERIQSHAKTAARYAKLLKEPNPGDQASMPQHLMEGEIERAHDQIETLTLLRDYIATDEVYRLGELDLRFADLLPEPDFMHCGCLPHLVERRDPVLPGLLDDPGKGLVRN